MANLLSLMLDSKMDIISYCDFVSSCKIYTGVFCCVLQSLNPGNKAYNIHYDGFYIDLYSPLFRPILSLHWEEEKNNQLLFYKYDVMIEFYVV